MGILSWDDVGGVNGFESPRMEREDWDKFMGI